MKINDGRSPLDGEAKLGTRLSQMPLAVRD